MENKKLKIKMLDKRQSLYCEWDFEKNNELGLDVFKVTNGSHKKVWWICPKCDSGYDMAISKRSDGANCPYCSGSRVNHTNNLEKLYPEIAIEWDYDMNNPLKPSGVVTASARKVWWKCAKCKSKYDMKISDRTRKSSDCPYCSGNRVNNTNSLASQNNHLAKEWHPTLNGDLTPSDVTYGSKQKVWWLGGCGHEWKNTIDNRNRGRGCPYCSSSGNFIVVGFNDMWTTNPELASMLADKEDGYKYKQNSAVKVDWKCPQCDNVIIQKVIHSIERQGISCPSCSDGIPFAERFMYNLLKEYHIDFQYDIEQVWSRGKRYDFYLPELNWVIETHGRQHYEEANRGRSLKEEQENDIIKKRVAIENGIENYIILDAKQSTIQYISKSILSSDIMNILVEIDFNRIGKLASTTFIKTVSDMWSSGMNNTFLIMKETKLSRHTIIKYLKRGTELGWCSYNPKEEISENGRRQGGKNNKEVVQLTKDNLFIMNWNSATEASKALQVSSKNISTVCRGKRNFAGGFRWKYAD